MIKKPKLYEKKGKRSRKLNHLQTFLTFRIKREILKGLIFVGPFPAY